MKYLILDIWQSKVLAAGFETQEQAEAWITERRVDPTSVVFIQYASINVPVHTDGL